MFHTIVSIKNDGHYFCRAGGNRPDGLNEPVTLDLLPQYDTDIESRANELWKKAVHTINNTTREERRVCYITLNRPEEEHSGPEDIPSVKAILNTLLPLEILLPVAENNKSQTINNDHPQKSCGAQPTTDEKY